MLTTEDVNWIVRIFGIFLLFSPIIYNYLEIEQLEEEKIKIQNKILLLSIAELHLNALMLKLNSYSNDIIELINSGKYNEDEIKIFENELEYLESEKLIIWREILLIKSELKKL